MSETNATCPNCGYCSHCGRSAHPVYRTFPYYVAPYQPPYVISWTTDTNPVMSVTGNASTHFVGGFTVNQ
jgi:hypothetical protein